MRTQMVLAVSLITLLLGMEPGAYGQCAPPLLDPSGPGRGNTTRLQDFHDLLDGLYAANGATRTISPGGLAHQVPPWFVESTRCTVLKPNGQPNLQSEDGFQPTSFADYLVSGDELSELMAVVSLGTSHERMLEIHRTVESMIADSDWAGLPCVTARINGSVITCHRGDTASDVTARVALSYFQAANNPSFPQVSRDLYRQKGADIAYLHLNLEYVNLPAGQCLPSAVTGKLLCNWVGGGANTSNFGLDSIEMWIGYHQDIVRMLLAAAESTRDPVFIERAREVVDQWLIASTFTGSGPLSIGRKNFRWNTSLNPIQPKPGDLWYWEPGHPAWDDSDAPRALWMGDVLRALHLSTHECAGMTRPYAILRDWVRRMQQADPSPPDEACIQWNADGTPFGNCGHDYYYTGLGAGLHTEVDTSGLQPKLDEALDQYEWSDSSPAFNGADCFGIYRGVRPVKALASAIGLDAATYGGGSCGLELHTVVPCRLLDTRQSGQPLVPGERRTVLATGLCGIPATAQALALNIIAVEASQAGYLTLFPDGCSTPETSAVSFRAGVNRANNALLRLSGGAEPAFAVEAVLDAPGSVHFVVDVLGYFE